MNPNPTHYTRLGGEHAVRRLVERFYELMDSLPEAHEIRQLHPQQLSGSREKLFKFLSGWLGGPPLYTDEYGHPRLRQRHFPFPISEQERDQWLLCMDQALDGMAVEPDLLQTLKAAFAKTADHMRNQH